MLTGVAKTLRSFTPLHAVISRQYSVSDNKFFPRTYYLLAYKEGDVRLVLLMRSLRRPSDTVQSLFSLLSHWALPTFHKRNKNAEANSSASSNIIRWVEHVALQYTWFKNKWSLMNQ